MKKLIVVVLLALVASACGSSSDATSNGALETDEIVAEDETRAVQPDDASSADEPSSDESNASESDEPDLPATLAVEETVERDCAHTVEEIGTVASDGPATEDDAGNDVPLPPEVKPEVDGEYLVGVDELVVTDLIPGTGREAVAGASVQMQYVGVLADGGEQFDASWDRGGDPFEFVLGQGQVISGWDEGIAGMLVGGRRVLQIPSAMAYGEQARGDVIGANADLVFIVDLLSVSAPPAAAPPIDDSNLGSFGELQIIDLVEGSGCVAEVGDIVTVHYVGVNADDGAEFDSSWGRGAPFDLIVGRSQVIDGWNEGIEGMKVGGQRILQIPSGLAYDDGDLVFRVHLETLKEAPPAHRIAFEGNPPGDIEVTTLIEGSGDEAVNGSIVDANIVVMLYKSNTIVQSTWQQGSTTQLALHEGELLPGLETGIEGTKVGELRQIILPSEDAYPDGIPPNSGIEEDDAIVFLIQPVRIINE